MLILILLLLLCAPSYATKTLKDGTPIILQTTEKMVSGETPEGSTVKFTVERDVLGEDGAVLVQAGATAYGKVTKSEGSGFFGQSGALNIALESATAIDGTVIPLRAVRSATADDQQDGMIVGAVLLSVFFVFMEGDDITIPPGTLFTGWVKHDHPIKKPGPIKPAGPARSAKLTIPAPGARVQKEDKLTFTAVATPDDPEAYVRLYFDDVVVHTQKGNLANLRWDVGRHDRLVQAGEHTTYAEITYKSGHIVKTPPVRFTILD